MRLFIPLLLLAASAFALQPDEDLNAFWKARAAQYTAARAVTPLPGWPGYETAVLATDTAFSKPPFVLVLRKTGGGVVLPFGSVESASVLLLDSDGDGTVDLKTTKNFIPGWVALRVPGARSNGAGFRALAERIYRQYDQEGGPVPAQLTLLVNDLKKRATDTKDPDRDLSSALAFYLDQASWQDSAGVGTLAALALALKTRGGGVPLVFLFLGEALESANHLDAAQSAFDRLMELDPKSVIGTYKKTRVDPAKYAAFQKAHPDFWASRD